MPDGGSNAAVQPNEMTEEVTMKNGYWKRPALVRQHDGGNLIVGPFQLNWYGNGVRLHVTWPRQRTLVLR